MPSLVIPNTVQVAAIWQLAGADHAVNVFHFVVPGGYNVNQAAVDAIAATFGTAFAAGTNSYRGGVADNFSLARVAARDIRVANQGLIESAVGVAGLSTADPLPVQTSLCITLRTALAGRSFRGRSYLQGWAEGSNDAAGRPTAVTAERGENFIGAIRSFTHSGQTLTLGVASRARSETNPVTSHECRDLVWDTQRRRSYPGI